MKYLLLLLFAALVFGLCFLADKGLNRLRHWAVQRPAVRLPLRYPLLSAILLLVAALAAAYGISAKSPLFGCAAALFVGVAIYSLHSYRSTRIDYTDTDFTFRSGKVRHTFRFSEIDGQRVAISKHTSCLVLCLGPDEVVLYSNMQGFSPFLEAAYRGWCQAKGLDPHAQAWHDPSDHRWFPDKPGPDDETR